MTYCLSLEDSSEGFKIATYSYMMQRGEHLTIAQYKDRFSKLLNGSKNKISADGEFDHPADEG